MRYTVSLNKQFVMKCFNYLQFHANVQLDTIILCDIIQPSMPNNKQSKTRAWCKTTVTALFYITGYKSFATSSQITISSGNNNKLYSKTKNIWKNKTNKTSNDTLAMIHISWAE